MPIPILNVDQPRPYSITEAMRDWGAVRDSQINRDEALGDIGRQQKVRDYYAGLNGRQPNPAALSAIEPKAGIGASAMNHQQAQMGVEQAKATKEVMTHFWHGLTRAAKAKGIQKGTPQFQQLGNAFFNSTPVFAQVIKNATGNTYDPTKNIDLQAAESIADPTPEEQAQAEIQQATMKEQALYPYKLDYAKAQAGIDLGKMQMQDTLARDRDETNAIRQENLANIKTEQVYKKPLPPSIIKQVQENETSGKLAKNTSADIDAFINQIDNKELDLGIFQNLGAEAQDRGLFKSTPQGRNFISFKSAIQRWANDSLKLAKGVQTDMDFIREKSAQIDKANDPEIVKQRLGELKAFFDRLASQSQAQNDMIHEEYHRESRQIPESESSFHKPAPQIFTVRPPNKPGFRILHNPKTGEYIYKLEGG